MILARPATSLDLDAVMRLEEEQFGVIDKEVMASRETMASRINLLNSGPLKWFWLAVYDGKIVGYMILQPTDIHPDTCASWEHATDSGKLKKTFNSNGQTLYGVSLAISDSQAPEGVMLVLMQSLFLVWIIGGQKYFMISSRIPGCRSAFENRGIMPEQYWKMTRPEDGKLIDPMLRYFDEFVGAHPARFLENGYPPDKDSMGHSVLCVGDDPVQELRNNWRQLTEVGMQFAISGISLKMETSNETR